MLPSKTAPSRPHTSPERRSGAISAAALAAVLLVPSCSDSAGLADSRAEHIRYEVRVTEGDGLVRVRAEIPADALSGALVLVLRFRDLRRHPGALKDLRAWSNEKQLSVAADQQDPGLRTIALTQPPGPVIVEYTMDPTFYPPGSTSTDPADARARLGDGIAILRTSGIFPILAPAFETARVTFGLPPHWVVIAPWTPDGEGFWLSSDDQSAIDYLALGLFEVQEMAAGRMRFVIAAPRIAPSLHAKQVTVLIEYFLSLAATPPRQAAGRRSVTIVPPGFMNGGAAGSRSIVQGPSAIVLSHEVFHWWTHSDLVRPKATWFSEGLTNYFAIKAAQDSGLVTEEAAARCFSDLLAEMRLLERDGPVSLAAASEEYAQGGRAQRLVYSKGTLLGFVLDGELAESGRSLTELVRTVLSQQRTRLTNGDLQRLMHDTYGKPWGSRLDTLVTETETLPELALGPATGESGCARYLAGR